MPDPDRIRNRLLAVIAALLAIAGLRWSYPVTMPLAAAIFIVAAAWPIKPWLDRVMPSSLSYIGTSLALFLILAGFFGAIYLSASQIVQTFADRQDQFREFYDAYWNWAQARGLPVPGGAGGYERIVGIAGTALTSIYTMLGYLGFIAVLVLLGLPEVPAFRSKIRDRLHSVDRRETFDAIEEIAGVFRSYVGVTMLVSLITGAASTAWALAMGLDLALTWGVLNFLLNFVPVFGNIIGIIPPSLYALVQFQDWTMPLIVFLGYALLQIIISNFIYPWMQGNRLSLSPAAILVALAFWGWVWGIGGALLAVPLTAACAIICGRFQSTDWIAKLLSKA